MWFEQLTGFDEKSTLDIAAQFELDGEWLMSRANGRRMRIGRFEMASLGELRQRRQPHWTGHVLRADQVVADVKALAARQSTAGATMQVASQFNMLEMVSPGVTPEQGVDRYEHDHTQGPACAIACGAGTIYRNYLVPVGNGIGQASDRQLNGLADLALALDVGIEVRNGYAFPSAPQLSEIAARLDGATEPARDRLMSALRVGIQWDTEVTLPNAGHTVTQVLCSALPIAYTALAPDAWEPFARLVLDATYEATFAVAVANAEATGNGDLYLTMVGGGAFGNPTSWILDAIARATRLYAGDSLDVHVVSYGSPRADIEATLVAQAPHWSDALFAEPPQQWGQRGDPYLWRDLHSALRAQPPPASAAALTALIESELHRLTGVDVTTSEELAVQVERYPTAGMSGGFIAPAWWRERLIPLLVGRADPNRG